MVPVQMKVDIYSEFVGDEMFTLDLCVKELEKLAKNDKKAALSLEIAKKKGLKAIRTKKKKGITVDKAIRDYAKSVGCAVATNDIILIEELKKNNIKVYRIKQRKIVSDA